MTFTERALAGCTMVITADRRKEDLAAALERHGARVKHAPAVSTIPHLDDAQLIADTRTLIAQPPDIVVVTTGIGFRSWIEAAAAAGLADSLLACLRTSRLIARGPKARGAIQGAGLTAHWIAETEQSAEILDYLLAQGVDGLRIAVQHHGTGSDGLDQAFVAAGATVQPLLIYGSGPPTDLELHHRHIALAAAGQIDAVLFASPPGAQSWLSGVRELGVFDDIHARVDAHELLLATVGPVTSGPLETAGLRTRHPSRWRLGALIRDLVEFYGDTSQAIKTVAGELVIRAAAVVLNGEVLTRDPEEIALIKALALHPGRTVSVDELEAAVLTHAGNGTAPQAISQAIERLHTQTGAESLVRHIPGKGYALTQVAV